MKKRFFIITSVILAIILFCSVASADITPPDNVNSIGKTVVFGAYEQITSILNSNGENIEQLDGIDGGPEPIQWIILAQDENKLLLLSQEPLEYMQFNTDKKDVSWASSSLRAWLNSTFFRSAFTDEEQAAILPTKITTGGETINSDWVETTEQTTDDKLFLLSHSEFKKYLHDDKVTINNYVNSKDLGVFTRNKTWWLRSTGKNKDEACFVGNSKEESGWVTDWKSIRPAMWIDISLMDWGKTRFAYLTEAKAYAEDPEKLPEAYAITDSLIPYSNTRLLSAQYRIDYAQSAIKTENYEEGINRLISAKQYINEKYSGETMSGDKEYSKLIKYFELNDTLMVTKYLLAVQKKDAGEYQTAIQMFTDIGQYRDSMNQLRECFDKMHIQYSWVTGPYDTVNAGLDKEYSETNTISGNDPHFGWSLGRFMMSGFTEEKNETSVPVFMKTPGDSLVLWFNLEQDINKLNNNKDLTINSDNNGSDRQFQVAQSNFGKGMLLIRHTDFRKNVSPVQLYSDYLAAHEDTGANTKVEIKEEGIYEVALDYEIKKDELFDKYNDYRIAFKFEVRNGSGMFFLFDVATGAELQDYSRTADGFRIDLANSHSLSVSYTRYAINQAETGLDVRKTGLASDGDSFEKVGYYEITVTNKETKEELTKHIFVGRTADLEEYQALSEDLSKFSK